MCKWSAGFPTTHSRTKTNDRKQHDRGSITATGVLDRHPELFG